MLQMPVALYVRLPDVNVTMSSLWIGWVSQILHYIVIHYYTIQVHRVNSKGIPHLDSFSPLSTQFRCLSFSILHFNEPDRIQHVSFMMVPCSARSSFNKFKHKEREGERENESFLHPLRIWHPVGNALCGFVLPSHSRVATLQFLCTVINCLFEFGTR